MRALALALLLLAFPARAEWTHADTALEVAYAVAHAGDWMQTRTIAANPDRFYETNTFLGRHPSTAEVDRYFAATLVGHVAVSALLPKKLRHGWQSAGILLEVSMLQKNARAGIGFRF